MNRGRGTRDVERCTFCEKDRRKVLSLIAGPPGIYICNECVELCNTLLLEELKPRGPEASEAPIELGKLPTPSDITAHLDQYVVGQEHAKRVLAVSVYNHYQRILQPPAKDPENDVELEKSNVLLVGPTGSGKTLLARTLARLLKVPFAISDATTLTEAGYVGEDVENIILRLVQAANYNIELAERGIVYVDEIDKIARTTHNVSITRDVSGEGVQQGLLKILEGTVANIPPQGGRKHPEQHYLNVNTSNILFICGGTFTDLEEIISRRVGRQGIGFHTEMGEDGMVLVTGEEENILRQVQSEDLVHFGLIPEFVGRLPVTGVLETLRVEDFVRILQEPKNALVRQFQKQFLLAGSELHFEDDALQALSEAAHERATGVRALRSIMEDRMLDVCYDLPTLPPSRYTVTRAFILGESPIEREDLPRPHVERDDREPEPAEGTSGDEPPAGDVDQRREAG